MKRVKKNKEKSVIVFKDYFFCFFYLSLRQGKEKAVLLQCTNSEGGQCWMDNCLHVSVPRDGKQLYFGLKKAVDFCVMVNKKLLNF